MRTFEYNYFRFGDSLQIDKDAVKYDVKKKDIGKDYREYFKHYNTNGDKKLDEDELTVLMLDLENADEDGDDKISTKEANKLLKSMKSDKKQKVTKTERKNFFKFLNDIQKNYNKGISNNSDGVIDEANQSGMRGIGDCWLLSQMRGMSRTDWGAKAIKDSISYNNEDDTYKVTLKGVDFEAQITKDEIKDAREKGSITTSGESAPYSSGDLDVLLLEIAAEKYFKQEVDAGNLVRQDKVLYGNQLAGTTSLQYMLTGKTGHQYSFASGSLEKIADTSRLSDYSKSAWKNAQDYSSLSVGDKKENTQNLLKNIFSSEEDCYATCGLKNGSISHAYTIKGIKTDKDGNIEEVILINPSSSHISAHYSFDEFLQKMHSISVVNENEQYDAFSEGFIDHPKRVED